MSQALDNLVAPPVGLAVFKKEIKSFVLTITDTAGTVIDLSGKTLRFTVETRADPPVNVFTVADLPILKTAATVTVPVTATHTNKNAAKYQWKLWEVTLEIVHQHGIFEIVDSSESST
jgi:hypothetical protein